MGLFFPTKGTVTVNHWNCRGTRTNPAWDSPSDGEKWMDLVSLNLLQERQEGPTALPGCSRWKALEHWAGSTKAAVGASCRSIHSPAQTSGFRQSQRNPVLSWAEPCLWAPELHNVQSWAPTAAIPQKPSLARRSSKNKCVFLLPYRYPLHFT